MVGAIGRLCDRGFRAWRKLRAVTICFPKRKWFLTCEVLDRQRRRIQKAYLLFGDYGDALHEGRFGN